MQGKSRAALLGALVICIYISGTSRAAGAQELKFDIGGAGLAVASVDTADSRPLLLAAGWSAGAALECVFGKIPIRVIFGYSGAGPSAVDPRELFCYRGFGGLRSALEAGYSLRLNELRLEFLAGGALTISEYSALPLVSAWWSIAAEAALFIPLAEDGLCFRGGIPLEYMFRGSTSTFAAGISAGISIPLSAGGAR